MIKKAIGKILGTKNDRFIKKYSKKLKEINAFEPKLEALSDDELKARFKELKELSLAGGEENEYLAEVFAITREASKRTIGLRHFDVQLIGAMVLNDGAIAEMKTGEGKTLVATCAVVLNAMRGKSVHVVTVNDYLAKRDAQEMGPLYEFLGFKVGVILSGVHLDRAKTYECNIVYGTNSEFGFDYLRDNMAHAKADKCQRDHSFVIVDEVDSILIDEARTPLIISGSVNRTMDGYVKANEVARKLERGEQPVAKAMDKEAKKPTGDFVVDEKARTILLTEKGIDRAEKLFGVDNLYDLDNAILAHQLDQALKAHNLFERDVHYVVRDDEVLIVDEFTGRISEGRRFSEGLHQALEAKENVAIQEESQTLADITYQNYFRMYEKLAGMTGTAQTEATEFAQIYKLDVISIPTNLPCQRQDLDDLIYKSQAEKFKAVINEVKAANAKGQPVLIGTASIERSEAFHEMLKKEKIPHNVLNAKNHEKEAEIIKDAGLKGAVTIATNMAGRGVDIKIDDEVKALGGLFIIGTERHESRRIDNQLRGRSGRQGDPGKSRFYLSLEDNLLRIFGGDRIKNIMEKLGIKEGESIESRIVTRAVENAQKKVESLHFESRKHILEYDDVANEQRKTIYKYRNELLDPLFDVHAKFEQNLSECLDLVFSAIDPNLEFDENYESVKSGVREIFAVNLADDFKELEFGDLRNKLEELLKNHFARKMSAFEEDTKKDIERMLYLQVLDRDWREHLYQMDVLKTGIGLRGYNQKDPLVEYKKESYKLFMELVERIKTQSVKMLFMVQFKSEEEREEAAKAQAKQAMQEMKKAKASEDSITKASTKSAELAAKRAAKAQENG